MARVRLIGFSPRQSAALAEALAGFGFAAAETNAADHCLAVIAGDEAVPQTVIPGCPLVRLGGEAAATGAYHFPLPLRLGALIALLKRLELMQEAETPGEGIGPFRFHAAERLMLHEQTGEIVRLTDKEAALLAALAATNGAPVSRETLLEEVWGYGANVTTHTLETHIYRLRQKLGGDEAAAALLSQSDEGYRLVK
jgi:hypothetical protein